MKNVTGAVAKGGDFFDRLRETERFWRDLDTDNLLLLAPRRVGKTSLMRKMGEDATQHGFTILFVDVSDCSDELYFIQRLYDAILNTDPGDRVWNQIQDSWLGKIIGRVQKVGGAGFSLEFRPDGAAAWTRLGEEFTGVVSKLEGRWLIQIDELPVFILKLLGQGEAGDRARVREFLYWMRRIRLQHADIRWMLAGSIGLDTVTARLNIADAINDLRIVNLGAFDTTTANALLQALCAAYKVQAGEAVRAHIVRRTGWPTPYYLQLIFKELRDVKGEVNEQHVDGAIDELLGHHNRTYFDYWRQRLYDELGRTDAEHAMTLLHVCCRSHEGASRSALNLALAAAIPDAAARGDRLRYLLDVFQSDGYLIEIESRWRFLSPLLREYWRRRLAPPEDTNA
jgi:uncharacterized protein